MQKYELVCPICGKEFINYVASDWVYKIVMKKHYATYKGKKYYHYHHYYTCSYTCMRAYDKEKGGIVNGNT